MGFSTKIKDVSFVLRRAVARRGITGTLTAVPRKVLVRLMHSSTPARAFNPAHPFDAEFGTDTGGFIAAERLLDGRHRKSIHNTGYYATSPSQFRQAITRLAIDFRQFTFVDMGAGKGRVLLMAADLPFRRVVGVELIPALQAVAQANIARYRPAARQCEDVECILSDVRDFVFPPGPLVIFLWNPFVGPVFQAVMRNLDESLAQSPRVVYVIYLKPELGHMVEGIPALHKLWEDHLAMTDDEFSAYVYPDQAELCAAYGTREALGEFY